MNPNPQSKSRILITGTNSGFGKYLLEKIGGTSWTRKTTSKQKELLRKNGVDVIIHCAFNSSKKVDPANVDSYLEDNVLLTAQLLKIPHNKFIFISSVEVYPKNSKPHEETEKIDLKDIDEMYGMTKLISENLIQKMSANSLILRCSFLLGPYSKKGNLIRLIEEDNPELSLSGESVMNIISYNDVLEFINQAIKKDFKGIYNVASSQSLTLKKIAKDLNKNVKFGKYRYWVGSIDNKKIAKLDQIFKKNSLLVIKEFLRG